MALRVLAGDVGGTKTALAVYERSASGWVEIASSTFPSADHPGLEGPARALLVEAKSAPVAAAFGIAGPVIDGRCQTTNLPWVVDARALGAALGIARVALMNDFEASARGLLELSDEQVVVLQEGVVAPGGHVAVIGAGTGLGQAILVPGAAGPRVLATEGGHADLAPRDEVEDGLLRFLRRRYPDHVSVERAVSGRGLAAIHEHVLEAGLAIGGEEARRRIEAGEDRGAVVGELGARGADAACARAVAIFASLYGAEAGNLALKTLPSGGLFVTGGIAPKMLDVLRSGVFLEAFLAKGRMRAVLERVRVSIVRDTKVGLYGAAALAESLGS